MDKDTQAIIHRAGLLTDLLGSEAWKEAKGILEDKLRTLDSWSTLPSSLTTATAKVKEMETRQHAIALVREWISELEGIVEQGVETARAFKSDDKPTVFVHIKTNGENLG